MKGYGRSKLRLPLAGVTTRIRMMDNTVISNVNVAGWEFYSGITGDDLTTTVQCMSERSGATYGTLLDSQHISDTALMAVRVIRKELKKFIGQPATANRLESMKTKAYMAVVDYYTPEPISSISINVLTRNINDKINERTRVQINMRIAGVMRNIVIDTYIGVD